MNEIVFLLEEQSASEFIRILAAKFFSNDVKLTFIVFEGKRDLEKRMGIKLRAYLNPGAFFIVLEDQDSTDCKTLKQKLLQKCTEAGKSDRCLVPEFQKISGARQIASHIDTANKRSRSFAVFMQGLEKIRVKNCREN